MVWQLDHINNAAYIREREAKSAAWIDAMALCPPPLPCMSQCCHDVCEKSDTVVR